MRPLVYTLKTGKLKYSKGLILQKYISGNKFNSLDENKFRNVLILTEHYPVYTIGIRRKDYTIEDEEHLRKLGAEFYQTNRGGLITFHGPGQLVVYPILQLKQFQPSMRWYVKQLEITVIDVCRKFNIMAKTSEDTGIWVGNNKICAIGIHGSRYITSHGIALNCDTDLKWFEHIVPCGLVGKGVTSITKELQRTVSINDVIPEFIESFSHIFNCDIKDLPEKDSIMDFVNQS